MSGSDAGGGQELGVDVQAIDADGVGDQGLVGQLFGLHVGLVGQRVALCHHQHLFIVEDGFVAQAGAVQGVGSHQQVDLVVEQGADAAELEFLLHVHIHGGPGAQVGGHHFQQPLIARVAFHADAQGAAFATGKLAQAFFGVLQLGQQPVGHAQQVVPGLGGAQAAAFTMPDGGAQLVFQLADAVAEGRLGEVQAFGGGGQRAVLVDGLDDFQMDAFQEGGHTPTHENYGSINERITFSFMGLPLYHAALLIGNAWRRSWHARIPWGFRALARVGN